MTDSSGNVVARYLYDPFGNLLAKSGPMADVNRYRFSSKEVHSNSGLYYYGYRFYDPNLQRWLNEDPLGEEFDINRYRSVYNNPINFIDPNGLWGIGIGNWNLGWGETPTVQFFGSDPWMDKYGELRYGTPPSEQRRGDPNSFGALHGIDTDFIGGQAPGDFIAEQAKKVCVDSAMTLASMAPVGGAKGMLSVGAKELAALDKAKKAQACAKAAGQLHHVISTKIWRAVERHPKIKGAFNKRDPRFVTRAVDDAAHRGYQRWHRELDAEVEGWLEEFQGKSPEEFLEYLRNLYERTDIKARFPNGF
jgi:RHS repeat-associated protein